MPIPSGGYLTDQFELDSVEAVGDTLLQRDALETLPDRPVEVWADLHLGPYYGDENETEALYSSQAKRGTTSFHAYATLYARVRNKRYTLSVRQLVAGDTTSDVLAEFLKLLDGLDLGVKAVYLDRGFYNTTCLGLLYAHNYAYVMSILKWDETIQNELNRGWSREIAAVDSDFSPPKRTVYISLRTVHALKTQIQALLDGSTAELRG